MSDRKVILKMIMSLDGFVTSPDGTHEWMFEFFGDDSSPCKPHSHGNRKQRGPDRGCLNDALPPVVRERDRTREPVRTSWPRGLLAIR